MPAEIKPVQADEMVEEQPLQEEPVAWRRGPKKQQPVDEKLDEKQWPAGKQKPQPKEEVEKVQMKPTPRKKPDEQKPSEQPELKPTEAEQTIEEQPLQEQPVAWKRGPKKPKPAEEKSTPEEQQPIQPDEIAEEQPLQEKPVAWRRGPKKSTADEKPEEKKLPMGKQKPQPKEEVEKVELKPIPRKKPEEKKPKEQPELKPIQKEEMTAEQPNEAEEMVLPKVGKAQIKAPKFIKKLKPEICKPNEPTELRATVDGTPFPEVKWYFNDSELHATQNYEMNIIGKVVTLKIANVTSEVVGTYTCQVKNEAGVAISRTNIALGKFYHQF